MKDHYKGKILMQEREEIISVGLHPEEHTSAFMTDLFGIHQEKHGERKCIKDLQRDELTRFR